MPSRLTRRELLAGAGAFALLSRIPVGLAIGPSTSSSASTPGFIDDLIARMTVEEKAGQLTLFGSALQTDAAAAANPVTVRPTAEGQLAAARAGRLTGIFNGSNVRWHQRLQQAAMESRLKIPLIFAADVIHGFTTVFPVPLAEAASFEPELARRTARAAAVEATAVGLDWTFAPMVDIARDARWGRGVEGSGEDVLLGQRMAQARVRGFQGEGLDRNDAMIACPKHFAAYGAAEGGLDYNTVDVSERTLREVYLPPFRAGFDAGALTTMASFNEISGVPATAACTPPGSARPKPVPSTTCSVPGSFIALRIAVARSLPVSLPPNSVHGPAVFHQSVAIGPISAMRCPLRLSGSRSPSFFSSTTDLRAASRASASVSGRRCAACARAGTMRRNGSSNSPSAALTRNTRRTDSSKRAIGTAPLSTSAGRCRRYRPLCMLMSTPARNASLVASRSSAAKPCSISSWSPV